MYRVPLEALEEITGKKLEKLERDYKDFGTSIPLSALPLDIRDRYIADYLLHDALFDIDPFALSGFIPEMVKQSFPIMNSQEFRSFVRQTSLVREAHSIAQTYSGMKECTPRLEKLAEENGISYRTLNRIRRSFMKNSMINRLIDFDHVAYQYNDHRSSICLYAVDYAMYRHIYGIKVSDNKIMREFERMGEFPCEKCPYSETFMGDRIGIPFTCKRGRTTMLKPANRYVLNRINDEISEQDALMCREGVNAWASEYHYTPARKKPTSFGYLYFSDHSLFDFFVSTKVYADGTFDAKRVYITGVMDAAIDALVGYALRTDPPNASAIAEAFANAVGFTVDSPFHGLCRYWYADNGRDYRSSLIDGKEIWHRNGWVLPEDLAYNAESAESAEPVEPYNPNLSFTETGILDWLGVKSIHALPYRACSKTLERLWRTIEEEYLSDLPGYYGNDPKHRPAKFLRDIKNGNIYPFEQFASYFADVIWPRLCNFKSTPRSKSPIELFNEIPHEPTITPSWRTLSVLKYKSAERKVQRSGIRFNNLWYWHPALASYIGEYVHVFAFDNPFNRSIAVTSKHQYLCEAHPVHHLDLIEDETWRVIQHLREQGQQRLEISSRLRSIEEIVLKSNILKLGLDIPAVKKIAYAPAIDFERDAEQAVDDKRIPEELKNLAEKYSENVKTLKSTIDDDPIGDYMRAIGTQILKEEKKSQ